MFFFHILSTWWMNNCPCPQIFFFYKRIQTIHVRCFDTVCGSFQHRQVSLKAIFGGHQVVVQRSADWIFLKSLSLQGVLCFQQTPSISSQDWNIRCSNDVELQAQAPMLDNSAELDMDPNYCLSIWLGHCSVDSSTFLITPSDITLSSSCLSFSRKGTGTHWGHGQLAVHHPSVASYKWPSV